MIESIALIVVAFAIYLVALELKLKNEISKISNELKKDELNILNENMVALALIYSELGDVASSVKAINHTQKMSVFKWFETDGLIF